jgi:hypothetical protein
MTKYEFVETLDRYLRDKHELGMTLTKSSLYKDKSVLRVVRSSDRYQLDGKYIDSNIIGTEFEKLCYDMVNVVLQKKDDKR